jgi:hypothetical protein
MDAEITQLCDCLQEAITLLRSTECYGWAPWLETSLTRIENGDASGITYLLGAYGGMGSFSDPYFDDRLDHLRNQIYYLAQSIRRSPEFPR